jgi:hypothetical protein
MSKAASNFKETDVKRLIRATINAGQKVVRIKLQAGGVELVTADGDADTGATANEWDGVE